MSYFIFPTKHPHSSSFLILKRTCNSSFKCSKFGFPLFISSILLSIEPRPRTMILHPVSIVNCLVTSPLAQWFEQQNCTVRKWVNGCELEIIFKITFGNSLVGTNTFSSWIITLPIAFGSSRMNSHLEISNWAEFTIKLEIPN